MDALIPVKTPQFIKKILPQYTWDFYTKEKKIYLTFDDGPIPEITEFVLQTLCHYKAKATFFCIGDNIVKHPNIFSKIELEGHAIGNHTMNHMKAWKNDNKTYLKNVMQCQDIIEHFSKKPITEKLFRPPFGQISRSKLSTIKKEGFQIVLWDILSKDWMSSITLEKCVSDICQNSKSGSILVFHDSIKAYKNLKKILPEVLRYFSQRGFTFEKITYTI